MLNLVILLTLHASNVFGQSTDAIVDNGKIVAFTRFLEAEPLNESAPLIRGSLLRWEEKSTDVVDVVCPSMFKTLLRNETPFRSELLAQFVIGSAAYQIEHPSEKGKLVPQQIAGVRSVLRTYRAYRTKHAEFHVPELDTLAEQESAGTLPGFMKPLIDRECKS
jgi:hypothetical protein